MKEWGEVEDVLVGIGSTYLAVLLRRDRVPDTGQSYDGSSVHQTVAERVTY